MALIEDTPETMIRTDLWATMSLEQLARQQDLMIDKLSTVQQMASGNASPSVLAMYSAIQMGMTDLNALMESRAKKGKF